MEIAEKDTGVYQEESRVAVLGEGNPYDWERSEWIRQEEDEGVSCGDEVRL